MSRKQAKSELSVEDYKDCIKGIYTTSVNKSTLDEAPMAYKSLEDIIEVIEASCKKNFFKKVVDIYLEI